MRTLGGGVLHGKDFHSNQHQHSELRKEGDMMESKIIKRISTLLLACALMATTVVSAFAANVRDEDYTRYNVPANTWVNSPARYKENDSKVYVAPSESPSLRTKVKTMCDVGGIITNKTKNPRGYVVLADDVKYAITNFVYEDGDYTTGYGVFMWLGMTPTYGSGTLGGVWSPDWTGNGTVTIV